MATTIKHRTREQWLNAAALKMHTEFFKPLKLERPRHLRISCGWPRGCSKAIGQCWHPKTSGDETTEVFISPVLAEATTPHGVLPTLLHELVHAYVGTEQKHGGEFRKTCLKLGLEGKMTATFVTEGTELHKRLAKLASVLGPYPHAVLTMPAKYGRAKKKGRRSLTLRSVDPAYGDFRVTMRAERLAAWGPPLDPGGTPLVPSIEEEGGE